MKHLAIRAAVRLPAYRLLPPGATRTYAALRYHGQHPSSQRLTDFVRRIQKIPVRHHSTALMAARAAFRAGLDDLVMEALDRIAERFPNSAGQHVLRCDLHTFYGRYDDAFESAAQARRMDPHSPAPAARSVRLAYRCWDRDEADELAVATIRQFPFDPDALWAVGDSCLSEEQFHRLHTAWMTRRTKPADLLRAVRQLATAALRARQIDTAIDLYGEAIVLLTSGRRLPVRPAFRRLEGRGAWGAIDDLCRVLDDAGIPFFFAAGTALGLIREGRPLTADNDLDVGVLDQHWDREMLIKLFTQDPRFDLELHPLSQKVGIRHRGGSPVDIFRFYPEVGRVWHDGVFVRWHNSPFHVVRRQIGSRSLPLPEAADTYLSENYGDWRTPNPAFDPFTDQAPNVQVTQPDHQRLHLIRRAFKQLTVGDIGAARGSLRLAGADDLATRLEARS